MTNMVVWLHILSG